jgi:hypothetical protein
MKGMTKIISAVLVVGLTACSTSPVVSIGKDSYLVSATSVPGSTSAAAKAILAANKTCAAQGKSVVIKTMQGKEAVLFQNEGGATVTFSCVDAHSPEYIAPTLRKDNGISTIQIQIPKNDGK